MKLDLLCISILVMFLNLFMNCCCELKEIICFVWFIVGISHGWGVGIGDFLLRKPGLDRD